MREAGMAARAGKSAVQVDHVEPSCPGFSEALGYGYGVGTVDGLLFSVPLEEADALAFLKIDGR